MESLSSVLVWSAKENGDSTRREPKSSIKVLKTSKKILKGDFSSLKKVLNYLYMSLSLEVQWEFKCCLFIEVDMIMDLYSIKL